MKRLNLHLISESSGQTVKHAANTALAKFRDIEVKKYHWPVIKDINLLEEVLKKIKSKPGVILYTIYNLELRNHLKRFCFERKLPCISVVSKIVNAISNYIGVGANEEIEYNKFDENYFDKVEAIEYTLKHDDGKIITDLEKADIVLIGPSRTSKTPTSVYLAYNGFKTANIPFIHDCSFPDFLYKIKNPIFFGLVINPVRLVEIRESRMNLIQMPEYSNYTDIKIIREECRLVRNLCEKNNWQVIDVSRRSIEETAAIIIKSFYEHKRMR